MTLQDSNFFAVKIKVLGQGLVAIAGTLIESDGRTMRGGVRVVDITDHLNPKLHGQTLAKYNIAFSGMATQGRCLYVAGGPLGIHMLDISAMAEPVQKGVYNLPGQGWCQDLFIEGNHCFAADGFTGIQIADLSSPFAPKMIGSVKTHRGAREVIVRDRLGYIADNHYLTIASVSNPESPALISKLYMHALGLRIQGNYCYVASSPLGMTVVDISDPLAPVKVGSLPNAPTNIYPATVRIDVKDNIAVKANGIGGIEIADISDPVNPKLIEHIQTSGTVYDAVIHEGWVLATHTGSTIFTHKIP